MIQSITPQQRAEIIYRFYNDKENSVNEIASNMGISVFLCAEIINSYFKKEPEKQIEFLTIESKLNQMD